jgi:hypothetical protein
MNDLEMVITDIGNADLYAECSENLYALTGKKFGGRPQSRHSSKPLRTTERGSLGVEPSSSTRTTQREIRTVQS